MPRSSDRLVPVRYWSLLPPIGDARHPLHNHPHTIKTLIARHPLVCTCRQVAVASCAARSLHGAENPSGAAPCESWHARCTSARRPVGIGPIATTRDRRSLEPKGKPIERWGRKASGLTAFGPRTAGLPGSLRDLVIVAVRHVLRDCPRAIPSSRKHRVPTLLFPGKSWELLARESVPACRCRRW